MAHEEIFRPDNPNQASRSTSRGELRRIAHGLYTWNLDEPLKQLVRRRWLDIAGIYFPDAVIVDRSAILVRPAKDGSLFLDAGPVVTNPEMSARTPSNAEALLDLLGQINHVILSSRSDKNPGEFKTLDLANRAGGTSFVAPELVAGTLREGWSFYETLTPGFRRGVLAMFLITEVHPFADGNGRTARALLSAELSANEQTRFLVPLSFRVDYLSSLRAMSHSANPTSLIRMVERAMRWSRVVDWSDLATAVAQLKATNALAAGTDQIDGGILRDLPAKATEI